jgi:Tfp pilus assembly protein PilF
MKCFPLIPFLIVAVLMHADLRGQESSPPPEMRALEKLVGSWKVEHVGKVPEEVPFTCIIKTRPVLGGRFIQQTGDVDESQPNQIGMYTYDSNRRAYRYWFFHSSGFFVDSTGTWNEGSQTFTFTNKPFEGATGVITVHFLDDTTYDWSIINRDAGGKVVFHMEGKAVRQKFAAPTLLDKGQHFKVLTEKMMKALVAGRCAEALEASDALIKLEPGNVDLEMGRGNALRGLGRNDEAIAAFDKAATSKNPAVQGDALRSKGEMLAKQGKYDEAIALFTKAIEISDWAAPRFRRAATKAMAGDTKGALADLKKAIEMAPVEVKRETAKDPAFEKLRDNEEFKNLMK